MVEQWNCNCGTVWWNSATVMVGRCGGTVWWNSHGTTVWWSSGTLMVKQCAGTVEQSWWDIVGAHWKSNGGTVWGQVEQ